MNRHKLIYDHKLKYSWLEPGDPVLLCKKASQGKHNVEGKWGQTMYEIIQRCYGHASIYRIKPYDGEGKVRIVHRNLLLPIAHNPVEVDLNIQESDDSRADETP